MHQTACQASATTSSMWAVSPRWVLHDGSYPRPAPPFHLCLALTRSSPTTGCPAARLWCGSWQRALQAVPQGHLRIRWRLGRVPVLPLWHDKPSWVQEQGGVRASHTALPDRPDCTARSCLPRSVRLLSWFRWRYACPARDRGSKPFPESSVTVSMYGPPVLHTICHMGPRHLAWVHSQGPRAHHGAALSCAVLC